ncbi:MAG: hypothetical protein CFE43_21315 [Burkholderiales bacterium PBB3]|nr:MAG: hypothetical protein CFE43_21315 [Burkholderiales bacterium PBB3]
MLKKLANALLLRGLWKFKPIHVVMFWIFLIYQGWMGSPYFMYHVVGAPEPGTAPRYTGTIRVEGELRRTSGGWTPPKYFINTDKGEVEFHCGYLPRTLQCVFSNALGLAPDPKDVYVIGFRPYWGLDYIKFPASLSRMDGYGLPDSVTFGRVLSIGSHKPYVLWFCGLLACYLLIVCVRFPLNHPPVVAKANRSSEAN